MSAQPSISASDWREWRAVTASRTVIASASRSPVERNGYDRNTEPSRQLALAPQPQVLVGLQLGHAQQIMQHVELVTLGELAQDGHLLGDEGDGFLDAALPWFLTARAPRRA